MTEFAVGILIIATGLYFDATRKITLFFLGFVVILMGAFALVQWMKAENRGQARKRAEETAALQDARAKLVQLLQGKIQAAALKSARTKIAAQVEAHLDTLARKRLTGVTKDAYGMIIASKWQAEVQYFMDRVVRPTLTDEEAKALAPVLSRVATELVEEPVRGRARELDDDLMFDPAMTPLEYEAYCALILEKAGWNTEVTKASGDQGADVLAIRGGRLLVVQCKKHEAQIGNKAVQEVVAARQHQRAHYAAVVSTSGYTRSAHELASSTGTLLLHHSQLSTLHERLLSAAPRGSLMPAQRTS